YAHVNVLADGEIREGIKAYGNWPTIPQLYIGGELVGGSDIIEQMVNSGELHAALGLPAPDRTPPAITVTPAAQAMLRKAIGDAGGGLAVKVDIDPRFRTRLALATLDPNAVTVDSDGIPVQFELAALRRADGLRIDFADDERGRGLVIDNPNAPPAVRPLSPTEAQARASAGQLRLVDVRPPEEPALDAAAVPPATFYAGPGAPESPPDANPRPVPRLRRPAAPGGRAPAGGARAGRRGRAPRHLRRGPGGPRVAAARHPARLPLPPRQPQRTGGRALPPARLPRGLQRGGRHRRLGRARGRRDPALLSG